MSSRKKINAHTSPMIKAGQAAMAMKSAADLNFFVMCARLVQPDLQANRSLALRLHRSRCGREYRVRAGARPILGQRPSEDSWRHRPQPTEPSRCNHVVLANQAQGPFLL